MIKKNENPNSQILGALPKPPRRIRTLIFALEIIFIIALITWWLSSNTSHSSTSLWVLFFYCFPSELLISPFPHEPALLYFAKFYSPFIVTSISVIGTVVTEAVNYSVFNYVIDIGPIKKVRETKSAEKVMRLFGKAPFVALLLAGFLPIPFYPFRILVVIARYPVLLYLLTVFLSRFPRFMLLSFIGQVIKIPDWLLATLMVILTIVSIFPILKKALKKKFPIRYRSRKGDVS
jgi:membrane protein YqaA with SNARE-associated domain